MNPLLAKLSRRILAGLVLLLTTSTPVAAQDGTVDVHLTPSLQQSIEAGEALSHDQIAEGIVVHNNTEEPMELVLFLARYEEGAPVDEWESPTFGAEAGERFIPMSERRHIPMSERRHIPMSERRHIPMSERRHGVVENPLVPNGIFDDEDVDWQRQVALYIAVGPIDEHLKGRVPGRPTSVLFQRAR